MIKHFKSGSENRSNAHWGKSKAGQNIDIRQTVIGERKGEEIQQVLEVHINNQISGYVLRTIPKSGIYHDSALGKDKTIALRAISPQSKPAATGEELKEMPFLKADIKQSENSPKKLASQSSPPSKQVSRKDRKKKGFASRREGLEACGKISFR